MTKRAGTRTRADRRKLLAELEKSGESVAGFARKLGVSPWTIYSWRRQEREGRANGKEERPEFVQVRVAPRRDEPAPLEVELREGIRVRVPSDFDGEALRRLLGVLASC
jgi:transposase-like protein